MQYVLDRQPDLQSLTLCGSPASMIRWASDCDDLLAEEPSETRRIIGEHEAAGFTACPNARPATWRKCTGVSADHSWRLSRTLPTCASPSSQANSARP